MTWVYSDPKSDLTIETSRELADTLTKETWPEGTTRTDGETSQVWRNGVWETVE